MERSQVMSILVVALLFVMNSWLTNAMPSYPLVIRQARQASDSPFGNMSTDDASVNLMLEPSAPWEDFIMPSPVVISMLGQLMVISGKVDFSLAEYAPEGGFKYMNHPDSFAASLVQVTNEGWNAFKIAQDNMDRIQLSMVKIPVQIRRATMIMKEGSTTMSQLLLPSTLQLIQDIGQNCVVWAKETDAKFGDVMLLIGELLEVSTVAKGKYQEKLQDVQVELNVTMQEKGMMDQIGERLKNQTAEMDAEVVKARKQYEDAMNAIPTGWKAIGQEFVHGLLGTVNSLLGGLPGLIGGAIKGIHHSGSGSGSGSKEAASADIHTITTLASITSLSGAVQKIQAKASEMLKAGNNTHDNVEGMAHVFKTTIDAYKNMFNKASCQVTDQALGFVNQIESIIGDFEGEVKQQEPIPQANQTKIMNAFNVVINAMKPLVAKSQANGDGLQATKSTSMPELSCSGMVGCNEKFKSQMSLKNLEDAENSRDKVFAQTMQYYEEMKDLVGKLAHLHLDEINFEQIVELLKQGILLLGKIREQWSKLIQFFSMVSIRTEVLVNQTLVQFLDLAKQSEQLLEDGHKGDSRVFFDLLEDQATDINKVAYFLYTLSSTYYEVSSKYLLDRLAGLSQLLVAKDEKERQHLLEDLNKNVNETQEAIKELAQEKRHNYDKLMAARKSELENIINKLGGPDADDTKIIQDASGGNQTFLS